MFLTVSVVQNLCLIITAPAKKVKTHTKMSLLCIAEITSFNHGKFHTTVFYVIDKVMREEVELFV